MYTKPGCSLAPTTEMNWVPAEVTVEQVMHRDWCEDDTCYCRKELA